MKGLKATTLAGALLTLGAPSTAAHNNLPQPTLTVIHTVLQVRDEPLPGVQIAAIVPTDPGQIGINPAPLESIKGSIGVNTQYLTEEGGTTKWIGVDSAYITIATTTKIDQAGSTAVATITKGVSAVMAADGGLDVLLSPGVRAKLEELAKQVTPCSSAARRLRARGAKRRFRKKRQGPACGFRQFQQLVAEDPELGETFTDQLTDQIHQQVDGLPNAQDDPHWQGDGGADDDSGYGGSEDGGSEHGGDGEPESPFDNNDEGFFEGETGEAGSAAGETVEAIVISTEEEAAAIALEPGVVAGGIGVTASSFLATIWGSLSGEGNSLEPVYKIPKERIHKITSSKTKSDKQTSTTSSSGCPTGTKLPECGQDCEPTSRPLGTPARATDAPGGMVEWACSKGDTKDCACGPKVHQNVHMYWADMQGMSEVVLAELKDTPEKPTAGCDGDLSTASSEWFGKISDKFCKEIDDLAHLGPEDMVYVIEGVDKTYHMDPELWPPRRKRSVSPAPASLDKRSPPESEDTYKNYKFFMLWYPVDDFEKATCLFPKETLCKDAYETLVHSNCGSNTGSPRNRLFVDAKLNVGCGEFGWHVEKIPPPPPPKPEVGEEKCHDPALIHEPVRENVQNYWSDTGCGWQKDKPYFRADTPAVEWKPADASQFQGGLPFPMNHYRWKIEWIEGCTKFEQQSAWDPVGDGSLMCDAIMKEHVKCPGSNGSGGGSKEVGCLRYDFYTT